MHRDVYIPVYHIAIVLKRSLTSLLYRDGTIFKKKKEVPDLSDFLNNTNDDLIH